MRLIDADTLKKEWRMGDVCETCDQDTRQCGNDYCFSRMDVCGMIDDAPTVNGWISVKDSMPEQQGEYLINTRCIVTIGWFSGTNGWVANDGSFYGDGYVTHWMPLPKPPEKEK